MRVGIRMIGWKKMIILPEEVHIYFDDIREQVHKGVKVQLGQTPQNPNLRKSPKGRSKR